MGSLWHDLRIALRRLRADRGFTAVALATLALGIGASVAIFTVVNAVMLRPLPYPAADRLVQLSPGQNANITLADALRDGTPALAAATGLSQWELTLSGDGPAAALPAQVVDAAFFAVFGIAPALGQSFGPEVREPARADVVMISHELWQTRFGGDPSIVGRRLRLEGYDQQERTVVGVMPRDFVAPYASPGRAIACWIPFALPAGRTFATDSSWYVNRVVGRLHAGATVEQAAAQVRTVMERLRADHPGRIDADAVRASGAMGLLDAMVGDVQTPLRLLLATVGLVLLLACANLANLLLARGEKRRQELAVRTALGAVRARLVREQLVEGTVLALLGGTLGIALAQAIVAGLRVSERSGLPRTGDTGIDGRVLAFALALSLLSVVGFALLPALRATRGALRPDLAAGQRTVGRTRGGRRLGSALIAIEVALTLVVVSGAGLLLTSLRAVQAIDPGLQAGQVLAVELSPPDSRLGRERSPLLYEAILARLRALPGVRDVAAIHILPFTQNNWAFPYLAEGHRPPVDGPLPAANFRVVTPDYFRTVGIPLLAGRDVTPGDVEGGERVALINATMAAELWPGERAEGRTIQLFGDQPLRVVGVVGDVRQESLDRAPRPELYVPLPQFRVAAMTVMLRTQGDPRLLIPTVRRTVEAASTDVPITRIRPLDEVLEGSIARRAFFSSVLTFFGVLALLLGGVGVYGVMAYAVGGRRHEFGVRMALGATAGSVVRGAMAGGAVPLGVGLVAGGAGVVATSRLLASLLYQVSPTDPLTLGASGALLAGVALLAIWIPARRAARVSPTQALRAE
jgi:predicted permease